MAEIVFGIGTSHGPMLHTPPEHWNQRVVADRRNKDLCYKGRLYDFRQLAELRKNWLPVVAAANDAGLKMKRVDYAPLYRSEAGTGSGTGFALWHP